MQESGTEATNGTANQNGAPPSVEGHREVRSKSATPSSDITASDLVNFQQQQVFLSFHSVLPSVINNHSLIHSFFLSFFYFPLFLPSSYFLFFSFFCLFLPTFISFLILFIPSIFWSVVYVFPLFLLSFLPFCFLIQLFHPYFVCSFLPMFLSFFLSFLHLSVINACQQHPSLPSLSACKYLIIAPPSTRVHKHIIMIIYVYWEGFEFFNALSALSVIVFLVANVFIPATPQHLHSGEIFIRCVATDKCIGAMEFMDSRVCSASLRTPQISPVAL